MDMGGSFATIREPSAPLWNTKTRRRAEARSREINSGIYAFDLAPLFERCEAIASQNAQGEYYLTDLVAIYRGAGCRSKPSSWKTRRKSAGSTAAPNWRK